MLCSAIMAKKNTRRDQRIQDAIHGIIDFYLEDGPDRTAWHLLQTPDFQRLRRIKQLGAAELVFPSATHSRFAHSVGVFHSARRLVERIRREIKTGRASGKFDAHRAHTAIIAALLHDLGHGPFSHVFEIARENIARRRGYAGIKTHEHFSAEMVKSNPIRGILENEGLDAMDIADIICTKPPRDMYHAIVSGTFDADRMDYMMRDKYMTGIGEGGFDTNWIMDNVRVAKRGGEHTFCLAHKALTAAEEFLLARYHLRRDIYFHKTTRAMECMLQAFFARLAEEGEEKGRVPGLETEHPLARFFVDGKDDLDTYRILDDTIVWSALRAIAERACACSPASLTSIARRLLDREIPAYIDVAKCFPTQFDRQIEFKKEMEKRFSTSLDVTIFFDSRPLSLYSNIGTKTECQHERLLIQSPNNKGLREITELPESIFATLKPITPLERYYFLEKKEHAEAIKIADKLAR